MQKVHDVQKLSFEDGRLHLQVDGRQYTFDLAAISPSLLRASAEERMRYEISPSGYGIHSGRSSTRICPWMLYLA